MQFTDIYCFRGFERAISIGFTEVAGFRPPGRSKLSPRWTIGAAAAVLFSTAAVVETAGQPIMLSARDGVSISGLTYTAEHPKAIILLFHQAESSKAEYATIAPRLVAAGFSALAIDQRSGGSLYGPNDTATRLGKPASYEQAKPDLETALDWAATKHLPVVLWGSSYSAALVFEVAAEHPQEVSAVMAFSPGEYLEDMGAVARAAAQVHAPIYVTSSSDADEVSAAKAILAASPARSKTQYVPQFGVHGASTLIEAQDPEGAAENWKHVLSFLDVIPRRD
jgi:dienelactone hydrolase